MDNQLKYFILAIFVQSLFPAILLLFMFVKRIAAVKNKKVHPGYFKHYDTRGEEVPNELIILSHHYNNLFQMPLLFLITGVLIIATHSLNDFLLSLSWLFVLARAIHSYIHLTSNHLPYRYISFGISCFILLGIWFVYIGKIFSS